MDKISEYQFEVLFKRYVKKYKLASTNAEKLFRILTSYGVLKTKC